MMLGIPTISILAAALAASPLEIEALDGGAWQQVDEVDGVLVEARPIAGSNFEALRLTAVSGASVDELCDAAWGDGSVGAWQTEVKSRKILDNRPDTRVFYDHISAPMVSDRDYTVRTHKKREPGGVCSMTFEAANELGPPLPDGWVRITNLRGLFRFEPDSGNTSRLTYEIFTDPGGSIPAFLARSSERKAALHWVEAVLRLANHPRPVRK